MSPSELTVGVTTFNRKNVLLKCKETWKELNQEHQFLLYDDCSTEYDESFLHENFPEWDKYRSAENSGSADIAMGRLMDLFLEKGREYLFLMDSDLLVDKDASNFICQYHGETDGIFSLFNTIQNHPVVSNTGRWVIKNHIGAAGTVWHRDLVKNVRENVSSGPDYDWRWSYHLLEKNIRIMVSERSYVQHLGFCHGQNSNILIGDFGINYYGYDQKTISFMLEEYFLSEREFLRGLVSKVMEKS